MPRFDGTGPLRAGPMIGWGRGFCGTGFGRGLGYGPGRGLGRGNGCGWYAVGYGPESLPVEENLRASLEARRAYLKAELLRTEGLLAGAEAEVKGKTE